MTSREFLTQPKRLSELIQKEKSDLEIDTNLEGEKDLPDSGKELYQRRVDYQNYIIQKQIEYLPKLKARIKRKIYNLKNRREQKILILRYVDGLEWDVIQRIMDGSKDALWGVHKRALKHLQEII